MLHKIKDFKIASIHLDSSINQQLLISNCDFKENDCLIKFSYSEKVNRPTYLTVQINEKEHITLNPSFLQYINHSCDPNVFFDVESFKLIAIKPISKGEELTFFYPSTEWEMIQPFECYCKSISCLHFVKGAKFLAESEILEHKFSNYIRNKIKATNLSSCF